MAEENASISAEVTELRRKANKLDEDRILAESADTSAGVVIDQVTDVAAAAEADDKEEEAAALKEIDSMVEVAEIEAQSPTIKTQSQEEQHADDEKALQKEETSSVV